MLPQKWYGSGHKPIGRVEKVVANYLYVRSADISNMGCGHTVFVAVDDNGDDGWRSGPRSGDARIEHVEAHQEPDLFSLIIGSCWTNVIPAICSGDYVYAIPPTSTAGVFLTYNVSGSACFICKSTDSMALIFNYKGDPEGCSGCRPTRSGKPFIPSVSPAAVLTIDKEPHQHRANMLADECGQLRSENNELLAENARLRRALDRKR